MLDHLLEQLSRYKKFIGNTIVCVEARKTSLKAKVHKNVVCKLVSFGVVTLLSDPSINIVSSKVVQRASITSWCHSSDFRLTPLTPLQIEYSGASGASGTLRVPAGESRQCVPPDTQYTLRPRSCHRLRPESVLVELGGEDVPVRRLQVFVIFIYIGLE